VEALHLGVIRPSRVTLGVVTALSKALLRATDDLERERPFPGTPGFLDHDREVEVQV
jgi:hypothetical protein